MHCRIANPPPPTSFPARDVSAQGGTTPQEVEQVDFLLVELHLHMHSFAAAQHAYSSSFVNIPIGHNVLDLPNQHACHLLDHSLSFLSFCGGLTIIIAPCTISSLQCAGRSTRSKNSRGSKAHWCMTDSAASHVISIIINNIIIVIIIKAPRLQGLSTYNHK